MEIRELKDPRDKAACEWAERAESVRTRAFIHQPRQNQPEAKTLTARSEYDDKTEAEFQKGL